MKVRRHAPTPRSLVATGTSGRGRVSDAQQRRVRAAIAKLPAADRALLARHGLRVELVPVRALEDGMLGATNIERDAEGRWTPTSIRVASRITGSGAESLAEVVQHEVGHALAVLRDQDRSEDAAHAYARKW